MTDYVIITFMTLQLFFLFDTSSDEYIVFAIMALLIAEKLLNEVEN